MGTLGAVLDHVAFLSAVEAASGSVSEVPARGTISVVTSTLVSSAVAIGSASASVPAEAATVVASSCELDLDFLSSDAFAVHAG